MSRMPDDAESRPGSATSLVRSVVGLYLRRLDGWIAAADLITLLEDLGVPAALARTAIARVKQKSLLVSERNSRGVGYRLNEDAAGMLLAGDRRIFAPRRMTAGDPWCLLSFSIPEQDRAIRHQLRRRLRWIGCGTVSPALWICPAFLSGEVEQILEDLRLREHSTVFQATDARGAGSLRDSVANWWDLPRIASLHDEFIADASLLLSTSPTDGADAFRRYVRCIDSWRPIPYLDPGLSVELLPADWSGDRSEKLLTQLGERLAEPSLGHVLARVAAR
jgi:phenylacetic acid degradation operon negative regulatory protein